VGVYFAEHTTKTRRAQRSLPGKNEFRRLTLIHRFGLATRLLRE
jgi:hypothetical protein